MCGSPQVVGFRCSRAKSPALGGDVRGYTDHPTFEGVMGAMKAISFAAFGGPEVLHIVEVPEPIPGPGQVRVSVGVAGVNYFDGKVRAGLMESMFSTPLPAFPGLELAGVVDLVGDGVDGVTVGDRVVGWSSGPSGAYAEEGLLKIYAHIPDQVSDTAAASLPVASEAAWRGLDALEIGDRDTLLIHGASGSVGELAVQFAVRRGATVVATASAAHHEKLRGFGALPTSYSAGWAERVSDLAPGGVDAVLDFAGKGMLPDSIALVGGTSRVLTFADPDAQDLGVEFSSASRSNAGDLANALADVVRGDLVTTVSYVFPLADAVEAHRVLDGRHAGGKIVLVTEG